MKPALAHRNHVERHHAAEHATARQPVAQDRDIADAVLQADDDNPGRRMFRNQIGHLARIRALDRDQHHRNFAKNGGIIR